MSVRIRYNKVVETDNAFTLTTREPVQCGTELFFGVITSSNTSSLHKVGMDGLPGTLVDTIVTKTLVAAKKAMKALFQKHGAVFAEEVRNRVPSLNLLDELSDVNAEPITEADVVGLSSFNE